MLEKRREHFLGSGELLMFRLWSAYVFRCMEGLSQDAMTPPSATMADFLEAYHFGGPRDEEKNGSGFSPLVCASLSGNARVVRELLSHSADVNARVLIDVGDLGIEKGFSALGIAAALCPQRHVREVVAALLEAGANPNARPLSGTTPLMAAAACQNEQGVRALLHLARGISLDLGLSINNASAINIAGFMGTRAILEALIHAGADRRHRCRGLTNEKKICIYLTLAVFFPGRCSHRNNAGGHLLTDIAHNPDADNSWFELALGTSNKADSDSCNSSSKAREDEINAAHLPRTLKWELIEAFARVAWRSGLLRSHLIMDLAHDRGGTPLSCATRKGNVKAVNWLLRNGAYKSLLLKDTYGSAPLKLAQLFGPHRAASHS